jgi:alkylhydroperoxidase/carboxymuconolactone decarboxylase family protein YurZ
MLWRTGVATVGPMEADLPELAKLIDDFVLSKIWSRTGLLLGDKSLITIASEVAHGNWDQVEVHRKSFLHFGGTTEELSEMLLHLTVYCGFQAGISGFRALQEMKAEISSAK